MTAPTALLPLTEVPWFGDRPVTDESRLVTAPILLVNTGIRKHWIRVSGPTGRGSRRAATRARDDLSQCHESVPFAGRDDTSAERLAYSTGSVEEPVPRPERPNYREGIEREGIATGLDRLRKICYCTRQSHKRLNHRGHGGHGGSAHVLIVRPSDVGGSATCARCLRGLRALRVKVSYRKHNGRRFTALIP